jgi:hypothetical protein
MNRMYESRGNQDHVGRFADIILFREDFRKFKAAPIEIIINNVEKDSPSYTHISLKYGKALFMNRIASGGDVGNPAAVKVARNIKRRLERYGLGDVVIVNEPFRGTPLRELLGYK